MCILRSGSARIRALLFAFRSAWDMHVVFRTETSQFCRRTVETRSKAGRSGVKPRSIYGARNGAKHGAGGMKKAHPMGGPLCADRDVSGSLTCSTS